MQALPWLCSPSSSVYDDDDDGDLYMAVFHHDDDKQGVIVTGVTLKVLTEKKFF